MRNKKLIAFFTLFVSYAAFSAWVYTRGTEQHNLAPMSAEALAGKEIWQAKNCIACHQVYGLGGYLGPDLTNIVSDPSKGESYAAAFIKNGGATMPNFHLTDKETGAVIAYLRYVSASARNNAP